MTSVANQMLRQPTPKKLGSQGSKLDLESSIQSFSGNAACFASILEDAIDQLSLLSNISAELEKSQQEEKALGIKSKQNQSVKDNLFKKKEKGTIQNLRKIAKQRHSMQDICQQTIRELANSAFDSLQNYVHDEMNKQDLLENTIQREKEASATLESLHRQIEGDQQLFTKEQQEKEGIIQQLKDAIEEIEQLVQSEHVFLKSELKAKHSSLIKSWQSKQEQIEQETKELQDKMTQEQQVHDKIVSFLDSQRNLLEADVTNWSVKYEQDMLSKSRQLEDLKVKRTVETDEFEKLVVEYENLEKMIEEYKIEKAAQEAADLKRRIQERSAKKIQNWWRKIIRKRKEASSANAKKGKGGKKK